MKSTDQMPAWSALINTSSRRWLSLSSQLHRGLLFSWALLSLNAQADMQKRCVPKTTELADRTRFVRMWMDGESARTIAEKSGTSVTTVYRWIRRWQQKGNVNTMPRRGQCHIALSQEEAEVIQVLMSPRMKNSMIVSGILRHLSRYNSAPYHLLNNGVASGLY
ncbi:putative Glutamate receptor-like 78, partial [Homarus americanus]